MKNLKKIAALVLVASVLTTFSCKKGDTGPQGLPGTNGTNGNANVIGTNTVTVNSSDWTWLAVQSAWEENLTVTGFGITQAVVDKGIVQVFIQYGSEWWSLPDVNGINSTQFGFGLNSVTIHNYNSDGSQPANPGTETFRVVIIPSSVRIANPNINYKNYNELKDVFHLKD